MLVNSGSIFLFHSLSLLHVTILESFAWLLELASRRRIQMRATVSYPSSNRELPFEARRHEGEGDDLSSYQLVTTWTSSKKKANERENEEEKEASVVFTVKEKNHLEDTAWILEKKIITNGFTLESVNLDIQVPSSV